LSRCGWSGGGPIGSVPISSVDGVHDSLGCPRNRPQDCPGTREVDLYDGGAATNGFLDPFGQCSACEPEQDSERRCGTKDLHESHNAPPRGVDGSPWILPAERRKCDRILVGWIGYRGTATRTVARNAELTVG